MLLVLLAFLGGPVGTVLGAWIDEGGAPASTFGLLLFVFGLVLVGIGKNVERLVFTVKQRPWLSGRLKRWQRLILPFGTESGPNCGRGPKQPIRSARRRQSHQPARITQLPYRKGKNPSGARRGAR